MKKTTLLLLALALAASTSFAAKPQHIVTNPGTTFQVVVKSNPTTGYSWRLGAKPDKRLVVLDNSRYVAPKTTLVGAGGQEIWVFKTLRSGKTQIVLEYARPWEKNIKPVETRVYKVIIK